MQEKARDEAAEAVKVYLNQYRAGTVAFTTVVVAEATLLADEEAVLATRQALFVANVTLIEALGRRLRRGEPCTPRRRRR